MTGLSYVFSGSSYSHSYTYTPGGSLLTRSEGDGGTNTFGYDGADQLVSEVRSGSSVPFTHGYTYDHNGNRLTQTQNGVQVQSFTYDGHDKLVSGTAGNEVPGYDKNGNETSNSIYGGVYHDTYDDEDRLTSVAIPGGPTDTFTYNGLGLRVGKTDSTGSYAYFTDGTSPASDVLSDNFSTFTPGISETKGVGSGQYASLFYLADASGNSRGLLNGSQSVTDGYNWDAFGTLVSRFGSSGTGYAWGEGSGYQTDADTGLKLLGHRYYDTRIGRFISQDPAGSGDNWYAYADNDPVDEVDPEGLFTEVGPFQPDDAPPFNMGPVTIGLKSPGPDQGVSLWNQMNTPMSSGSPGVQPGVVMFAASRKDRNTLRGLAEQAGYELDRIGKHEIWKKPGQPVVRLPNENHNDEKGVVDGLKKRLEKEIQNSIRADINVSRPTAMQAFTSSRTDAQLAAGSLLLAGAAVGSFFIPGLPALAGPVLAVAP